MWHSSVPAWELILRSVIVYGFLLIALRLTGKRQVGQLAPFDLVLLLVLSNAVQDSINAGDNSLVGGLISATALIGLNFVLSLATFRHKKLEAWIEGQPQVLIHNGKLYERALATNKLTQHELAGALRRSGCTTVDQVELAMLENNGSISVITRKSPKEAS
jgi:uncharacterized membrane protein YcaP (DUF421 family)